MNDEATTLTSRARVRLSPPSRMSSALRLSRAAPGGVFALSARARVARKPRARLPSSRAGTRVSTKAFAYVNWLLDSPGCSGHRSGDSEAVGVENSHRCPPRPIDLGALCESSDEAVVGAASFAVRDGRLFVRNAHAAELEALEERSSRSESFAASSFAALDPSRDEYDSFIEVEEDDEALCLAEEILEDGDVVCGVEDPFEFEFYPAAKSAQPKTSEKKTENERLDAIAPRAVRVDGLRLKPRGEAELKPGALVDIGLEATAFADPVATFGKSQKDFYEGVFEVHRVVHAHA